MSSFEIRFSELWTYESGDSSQRLALARRHRCGGSLAIALTVMIALAAGLAALVWGILNRR